MPSTTTSKSVNTQWTTCGRKLLLNDKTFFIRGINYAPTPIGKPGRLDMLGHRGIFTRDLKNLRAMHANAVKTYDYIDTVDHTPYLDAAYNDGKQPIYTVFAIWIDQSLMEPTVAVDSPEFERLQHQYYTMAKQTSGHPGLMGYSVGGEMNSIVVIHERSFWHKFNLLAAALRRGMRENGHAQKLITTTFVDDGSASFKAGTLHDADVDLWGSNVYQSDYAGYVIPTYMRVPTDKPLLVSEYGYPYATNTAVGDAQELHLVADLTVTQSVAMEQNFNLTDELQEQVVVGGFVFEYSDEWWKSGAIDIHDLGGVPNGVFPLGFLAEEYFGIFAVQKSSEPEGLDVMHPRPTVGLLAKEWGKGALVGENVLYTKCKDARAAEEMMLRSQADVAKVELQALPTPSDRWEQAGPGGFLGILSVCAIGLLALVALVTAARRARYRRIPTKTPAYPAASYRVAEDSLLMQQHP